MIVVADSSPLHYLILLEQAEILRRLYENVLIPDAVAAELRATASPPNVSEWVSKPPSWLRVVEVTAEDIVAVSDELDLGERAAIALAERPGRSSFSSTRAQAEPKRGGEAFG